MGVEKIKAAFENGKKAFIPYVMGGDGGLEKLKERIVFLMKQEQASLKLVFRFQIQLQMAQRFKEQGNER